MFSMTRRCALTYCASDFGLSVMDISVLPPLTRRWIWLVRCAVRLTHSDGVDGIVTRSPAIPVWSVRVRPAQVEIRRRGLEPFLIHALVTVSGAFGDAKSDSAVRPLAAPIASHHDGREFETACLATA